MSWAPVPKPANRGTRFEAEDPDDGVLDYARQIDRIGRTLDTVDRDAVLARIPGLRRAAAAGDEPGLVAEVDRIEGVLTSRQGEGDRARQLLNSAASAFHALDEWVLEAQALADLATLDHDAGDLTAAAAAFGRAAELAAREPYPAPDDASRYAGGAGICHLESGQFPQAIEFYRRAGELAVRAGEPNDAAMWCHDLGIALDRIGDENGAVAAWLRTIDLDPIGDTASRAWSRLSQHHRVHGMTDLARDAARRALDVAGSSAVRRNARMQALLLAVAVAPRDVPAAELRELRAESLAERDRSQAAAFMAIEAGLAHRFGRLDEAEALWDAATTSLTEIEDSPTLAELHADRATKYAESRDHVRARIYFLRAQELYQSAGRTHEATMCSDNAKMLGPDNPAAFRTRYREIPEATTREQAHGLLGGAGIEFGYQRMDQAIELADRALAFFTTHHLTESELETRLLLASAHVQAGRPTHAVKHLGVLLSATDDGLYPVARGQALCIQGSMAVQRGQIASAMHSFRQALKILPPDTVGSCIALLNLSGMSVLSDPEEAIRGASSASKGFQRHGIASFAARADLFAAVALARMGAWRSAFDLAVPALLVVDVLRATHPSPADRESMRKVWAVFQQQVLEMLEELDDPRLSAEVLERLRATATAPDEKQATDAVSGIAELLSVGPLPASESPAAIAWGGQWSTADALLDDIRRLPVGLPPLVAMPWGVALEPYERIAGRRLVTLSERHCAERPMSQWADQIAFP